MKIRILLLFLSIGIFGFSQEQKCICCTPAHDQFDFWLGDWEVFNAEGEKVGENLVQKLEDNCLVSENWTGDGGETGKSFNYYDPADSTWNQLWISSTGRILELKGKAENEKMILKSAIIEDEKGRYYNQITWSKNPDGSVTQLWQILDPQGNILTEAFKGIYRKKEQKSTEK